MVGEQAGNQMVMLHAALGLKSRMKSHIPFKLFQFDGGCHFVLTRVCQACLDAIKHNQEGVHCRLVQTRPSAHSAQRPLK